MAGASLLALLDDISTILDDVATMTKVAAKKTAGVLGDDLALNANQVAGVRANRELPVVWAVAKGSLWNKAILVPAALAISALAPWAVTPLLLLGGLYLCYEGAEKLAHRWLHPAHTTAAPLGPARAAASADADTARIERGKIKGAIRTDFILSAEILVIALGTVAAASLLTQFGVLAAVALAMTVFVYGLVAMIVKLDDIGLWLLRRQGAGWWPRAQRHLGSGMVAAAPKLMRTLSVLGTAAMFLVGGGIIVHAWPALDHVMASLAASLDAIAILGPAMAWLAKPAASALIGLVAGALVLLVIQGLSHWRAASQRA